MKAMSFLVLAAMSVAGVVEAQTMGNPNITNQS
jgi:hypothetical protein